MNAQPIAAVILAAGQGTRMKSSRHKVLHPLAGQPMLFHLLDSLNAAGISRRVVIVGAVGEQVEAAVAGRGVEIAWQREQLGTAHAALQARDTLSDHDGIVLVCFGDTPLLSADTVARLAARLAAEDQPAVAVLGFRPPHAAAYGRIIADDAGNIAKMVEFKDASADERAVDLCNSGVTAVHARDVWALLDRVGNANAAGEYYLPDIVMLAIADGRGAVVIETGADEVAGINSRAELAAVEGAWQAKRRSQAMADGVTLVAPDTVFFAHDTKLGRDVTIEPNVVFGPGVTIADDVIIHAFSHLEGASVASKADVGPYARLRPGAALGEGSRVGNFVEVKNTTLGTGAKANHLTYLGDAIVGANVNIGAGTITCNYDGFFKYRTHIGEGAFIGSNSALVAPVSIGAGALVAAGSTVTRDVEADALVLVRAERADHPGWAKRFRARQAAAKAAKSKK
ncbi:bifunctional N-acetylglucosamine-1-phosphate uridyltransferase/glucosamine-1-phosphate acetyltransferase [Sphingomonas sp. Leaf67]|uniref:bifunctional UDP-N-acetylglucosamine diphosphorylase/glucosamine-1-phosphate N-acetyltransferase GlmU n=1 Tax=Sphingomonas sp. Leaf67 TaxID=1736230 RepID=UPI0006F445E4|nr:bifunctional UDP-N-acetylglucosamine diphosphorylase/glucosamine-1-phosphate N-acetyltransferase GlmU [Sphingomonas sp. Leaf67]KQN81593.1 bifunctional N-acetylglucosamine-1-phosphate uridyltransferase/glucosamine-1-phosphate acetyltransferase [Sphingomonas sp. Leaf67]